MSKTKKAKPSQKKSKPAKAKKVARIRHELTFKTKEDKAKFISNKAKLFKQLNIK